MPLDYVFFVVFRAWASLLLPLLCAVPATFMPHFEGEGYSVARGWASGSYGRLRGASGSGCGVFAVFDFAWI